MPPNPFKVIDAAKDALDVGKKAAQRGGQFVKDHKVATGVVGAGGVGAYALSGGGDDDSAAPVANPELVDRAGDNDDDTAAPAAANPVGDAFGGAGDNGIIEFDDEVLEPFIAELNSKADDLEAVVTAAPDAFAALQSMLRRDALGAPTRSGSASPILADVDAAITKTQETYIAAANGVITQLRGDAKRLTAILNNHLDNEEANVAAISSIDSNIV